MQHPVPEKVLTALGDVTASFALLEEMFRQLVGPILCVSPFVANVVTCELLFRTTLTLAKSLARERYGKANSRFEVVAALVERGLKLEEDRNRLMHSLWLAGDSAETVMRKKTTAKLKHGLRFEFRRTSYRDIQETAMGMKVLAFDVQDFYLAILEHSPSEVDTEMT